MSSTPKVTRNLSSRIPWSTVSNAAERSSRTSMAVSSRSTASRRSERTRVIAVSVECPRRKPDWVAGSRQAEFRLSHELWLLPHHDSHAPATHMVHWLYIASTTQKCREHVNKPRQWMQPGRSGQSPAWPADWLVSGYYTESRMSESWEQSHVSPSLQNKQHYHSEKPTSIPRQCHHIRALICIFCLLTTNTLVLVMQQHSAGWTHCSTKLVYCQQLEL